MYSPDELDGMTVDVKQCARCQCDHDGLVFRQIHNQQDEYTFWSMCPKLNEPIALAVWHVDGEPQCSES